MVRKISAKELYEKVMRNEKVFLLDVRSEEKFHDFHIEAPSFEIRNIPKKVIFEGGEETSTIPKDEEIIVTCTTGNSATKCAAILAGTNHKVLVLEGGITAWKEFLK